MYQNAMELSLNGSTFSTLKDDFDSILATTLGNMERKGADEAVITLKLGVSLEKQSIQRNGEPANLTKPTFKHDISSVMQVKNKKSGSLSGDYELVWDEEEKRYVMRKITNGQVTMFDEDEENEHYAEDREIEHGTDEEETEYSDVDDVSEEPSELSEMSIESFEMHKGETTFEWLSRFVDRKIKITEAMGNYAARTDDDQIVLTSSTADIFHCDADDLAKHVGHDIVCVGYGDERIDRIAIECEECSETLFSIEIDDSESGKNDIEDSNDTDREEEEIEDGVDDDSYGYSEPEEGQEES